MSSSRVRPWCASRTGERFRRLVSVGVVWVLALGVLVSLTAAPASGAPDAAHLNTSPLACDGVQMQGTYRVDSGHIPSFDPSQDQFARVVVPPGGTVSIADAHGVNNVSGSHMSLDVQVVDPVTGLSGNQIGFWQWWDDAVPETWSNPQHQDHAQGPYTNPDTVNPKLVAVKVHQDQWLPSGGGSATWSVSIAVKAGNGDGAWCAIFAEAALNAMVGDPGESGTVGDPVNSATGNLYDAHEDLAAPAGVFGLGWSRAYNSLDGYAEGYTYDNQQRVLSPKFTTPVDQHLRPLDTTTAGAPNPGQTRGLEYLAADGRRLVLPPTTPGSPGWTLPASLIANVTWDNTARVFTLTQASGATSTFDDLGNLVTMSNGQGQTVRVCRDGSGRPVNLRTDTGSGCAGTPAFQLTFSDPNGDGLIDRVTRSDGVFVDYQYSKGRLRSVSYPRAPGDPTGALLQAEAGTGTAGSTGDGGPAATATLSSPQGMAYDRDGNLYVADSTGNRVRRIDTAGTVTTVAGTGTAGGLAAPAVGAQLSEPGGVAVDAAGNVFVADARNHRVRRIDPAGNVTTIAGTGDAGFSGDTGPATAARLNYPSDVAVDAAGQVYIADQSNGRIRKVDTAGVITTVASGLSTPRTVAVDSGGLVYTIQDTNQGTPNQNQVTRIALDGTASVFAGTGTAGFGGDNGPATSALLNRPTRVAAYGTDVYIADTWNYRVRKVSSAGTISTVAGNGTQGYAGDGGPAMAAQVNLPYSVAVRGGELFVADYGNHVVRRVNTSGTISTIAGTGTATDTGDGQPATAATLKGPNGIAVDGTGQVFISDFDAARVREINSAGVISSLIGTGAGGAGEATVAATTVALNAPTAVAFDTQNNLYVADTGNHAVRRVDPSGAILTVAGTGTAGYAGDGERATGAQLRSPAGIAVDGTGTVFVADTANHRVRAFTVGGAIATRAGTGTAGFGGDSAAATAAQVNAPQGLAVDGTGRLLIADTGNHRVRRVDTAATPVITTVAGTGAAGSSGDGAAATGAQLNGPVAVGTDAAGNITIADTGNHRVRRVDTAATPVITTVAGTGTPGYTADNGDPAATQLNQPRGVAVEDSGAVHIADTANHRVRFVAPEAGYRYYTTPDSVRGVTRIEHTQRTNRPPLLDVANTYDTLPAVSTTDYHDLNHVPGRVLTQDQPAGDHLTFTYGLNTGPSGTVTQTTDVAWCSKWTGTTCDPAGTTETTHYVHGVDGRLISVRDTNGSATAQTLDRDRLAAATDRNGGQTGAAYDPWGRVVQQATGEPATGFVPPLPTVGGTEPCVRNSDAARTFPTPNTGACAGKNFTLEAFTYCTAASGTAYDPRVATHTDATGAVTKYLYGSVDPANPCPKTLTQQFTPTRVIDPLGHNTDIVTAGGGTRDTGLVTSSTDADGIVTQTTWDTTRRLKLAQGTGPGAGTNWTYFGYDPMGRPQVTRTPLGEETWTVYDANGRVTDTIGPVAGPARTCTPAAGCNFPATIPAVGTLDGPTTHSDYAPDGLLIDRQQRVGRATVAGQREWDYDTYYTNAGADCSPPAAGCERETKETAPSHAYDPANPGATTQTVRTTHYNGSDQAVWVRTSDNATVPATPAVTATTNYQTNPADAGTNLGLGRVYAQVSAGQIATRYGYDGNLTATGNNTVSGNGLVTSSGVGANISTKAYDKRGRVIEERGPAVSDETSATVATCVHYTYDALDRAVLDERGAAGPGALGTGCVEAGSTLLVRTRHVYDAAGRATHTVVDLNNNGVVTDPTCPTGGPVDAADVVNQTVYSNAGRVTQTVTTPQDATWKPGAPTGFTGFNWCTGTGKIVTTKTYDATTGWLDHVTPPTVGSQAVTYYQYDADGRVTETDLKNNATPPVTKAYTKTTYDPAGRVLTTAVPSPALSGDAVTVTCYNAFGDKTYTSDPHTGVNLATPCTNGLGTDQATFKQWQSFDYYDDGSLKYAWSALRASLGANSDWAKTAYFYDGRGNRTARQSYTKNSSTDTNHFITERWAYNADNQITAYTDPIQTAAASPAPTKYEYYANTDTGAGQLPGQLKSITQPSGRQVTATYRPDGRLAAQKFTGPGQLDIDLAFGYDANGHRTRMSDATGADPANVSTFTYDRLGRLTSQTTPNLGDPGTQSTESWLYTLTGNIREMVYPDGAKLRYTHDTLDRLTTAAVYNGTTCCTTLGTITRNVLGYVTGDAGTGYSRTWTMPANGSPNPTAFNETVTSTPTNVTVSTTLSNRADGRLASETTGGITKRYGYDDAGQLCAQGPTVASVNCATPTGADLTYTYNTRGLRLAEKTGTAATYRTYDDNGQLCTAAPTTTSTCANPTGATATYQWDLDGRQTVADTGIGGTELKNTTTYDARGLIASIDTSTNGTPTARAERRYNAAGQFVRTTNGTTPADQYGYDLTWDPTAPVPQVVDLRVSATTRLRWTYGLNRISITGNGSLYLAYDAKGSGITTGGAPDGYDPYGNPTGTTTPGSLYFGYRGELTINGIVHLRARDYDTRAGEFTKRDAIDGDDGTTTVANQYHYAWNDPLNSVDPSGNHSGPAIDGDMGAQTLLKELQCRASFPGWADTRGWDRLWQGYSYGDFLGAIDSCVTDPNFKPSGSESASALKGLAYLAVAVPFGFKGNSADFLRFSELLYQHLDDAGFPGARAYLQGSAVSGRSHSREIDVNDEVLPRDLDVAIEDESLFTRLSDMGLEVRGKGPGNTPRMLLHADSAEAEDVGLAGAPSSSAGVQIEDFMVFRRLGDAFRQKMNAGQEQGISIPKSVQEMAEFEDGATSAPEVANPREAGGEPSDEPHL